MRSLLLLFLLLASSLSAQIASILPANTYIDWTYSNQVGIRGGLDALLSTKTFGANIPQGSSAATFNSIMAGCSPGQYALLLTGDTTVTGPITIPTGVELRFADANTRLIGNFSGTLISTVGSAAIGTPGNITGGYTNGSTTLTFSGGTAPVTGDLILIYQDDEPWVYLQTPDPTSHITAFYRCENVTGSTITIWPKLHYGSTGFNPKFAVKTGTTVVNAGVNLNGGTILPGPNNTYPIALVGCYNCYVTNGKCNGISGTGCYIDGCLAIDVYHYDVSGVAVAGDGYGVQLDTGSPGNSGNNAIAVYNCIFDGMYHGILTSGSQGCLFAFNYSVNEHASTSVLFQTAAFNASHGAEGMMCLWEGNYGNFATADQIHGGSAYQTWWRNRFHGVDNYFNLSKQAMLFLSQGSYTWNGVGNVLGDTLGGSTWPSGTTSFYKYKWTAAQWDAASSSDNGGIWMLGYVGFGQPLQASVASTFTFYANWDYWNNSIQDNGAFTIDNSLGWPSKPTWFGILAWPAYDPSSPLVYGNTAASRIPAGYRYIHGFDPPSSVVSGAQMSGPFRLVGPERIN